MTNADTFHPGTNDDVELVREAIRTTSPCPEWLATEPALAGLPCEKCESRAVVAALAAACRLLPEPTQTHTEWGVWWHATDPDGIAMTDYQHARREQAESTAKGRIGQYGITGYSLVKCEHRRFADGSEWTSAWDRVETVMP